MGGKPSLRCFHYANCRVAFLHDSREFFPACKNNLHGFSIHIDRRRALFRFKCRRFLTEDDRMGR